MQIDIPYHLLTIIIIRDELQDIEMAEHIGVELGFLG